MRLTMKAIIRWEQLNKKPFSQLDYGNDDDVVSIFYTCQPEITSSLADFKKGLTNESVKQMISDFEHSTALTAQFQPPPTPESKTNQSDDKSSNRVYIKDIISVLILHGLDSHFALNEMELCDLPLFLQAHDRKIKEELSNQRLWTYLQVFPYLKEGTTIQDFFPFDWEKEVDAISEEEKAVALSEVQIFLQSGLKK